MLSVAEILTNPSIAIGFAGGGQFHRIGGGAHPTGMGQEIAPGIGQFEALGDPFEQGYAKAFLKGNHLP